VVSGSFVSSAVRKPTDRGVVRRVTELSAREGFTAMERTSPGVEMPALNPATSKVTPWSELVLPASAT